MFWRIIDRLLNALEAFTLQIERGTGNLDRLNEMVEAKLGPPPADGTPGILEGPADSKGGTANGAGHHKATASRR